MVVGMTFQAGGKHEAKEEGLVSTEAWERDEDLPLPSNRQNGVVLE